MPTYEYRCNDCLKVFTIDAKMSDPAPTAGPGCALKDCTIEKKMSRVTGWIKGKATAPSLPLAAPVPKAETYDPVHLCSKYCDHHPKI